MRVTQKMMQDRLVSALQAQRRRLDALQTQAVTQKRVTKPSDDPVAADQVVTQGAGLDRTRQYLRNVSHLNAQLRAAEGTLTSASSLIERVRSLAIAQSNSALTSNERTIAANEVQALRDQLLQLANAKFGGNSLFAGRRTDVVPFSLQADGTVSYAGDDGAIELQVGDSTRIAGTSPGSRVFQSTRGEVDIFTEIQTLITALNSNNVTGIEAQIDRMTESFEQVEREVSSVGSRMALLEVMEQGLNDVELTLQTALSETQDVDLTKALSDLASQQSNLEVSMAVAAQVLPLSLLDFLR
ncbi:MAG: flagellar hook-associated protein FlgL [Candidatus Tectomicrobia bacterium]|nr:flagellar hook-associated protein FlgL [Candidatus Tectomicrobia bacterium]